MDFVLRQTGRAGMDFAADLGSVTGRLRPRLNAEIAARGLDDHTLADDLDRRLGQVDAALAGSDAYRGLSVLTEWAGANHGRLAHAAFDEQRADLEPRIRALQQHGRTTLEARCGENVPDYFRGVWIHRTTGGWDGHPYQGFVHGELIHREYVAKNYPGQIFLQRRQVLDELPRSDYRRILEFGTSSGHFTMQLAEAFPQAEIWGVDLSLRMLEQAQRVGNELGHAWKLFQVPAEDTGFEAESFDLVASYIVLHEIPAEACRAQMREAFRVLRPGGDMIFCDVTRYAALDKLGVFWAEYGAVNGGEPYWREAASLDLAEAAKAAGFEDVKSYGMHGKPYPWIVYGRKS